MRSDRIYLNTNKPLKFKFAQNRLDFIVEEIPSREFKNRGNFFIMKIKKEYTSTWDLIYTISKTLRIPENLIGYAGLKDKNATTTQYISIPLNKSRDYEKINSSNIKVVQTFKDDQKIKLGDLKGNRFTITLKEIDQKELPQFYQNISKVQKHGMPNYFGFQRFGRDVDFEKAKRIAYGEDILGDKKLENLLVSTYQSYFFNSWLCKRVELSKKEDSNTIKSLDGDILSLEDRKTVTGLMPGRKIIRAKGKAREIEEHFDDEFIHQKGSRRDSWVYPKNIQNRFIKDKNWMELSFELPKSSYATVFIEAVTNRILKH